VASSDTEDAEDSGSFATAAAVLGVDNDAAVLEAAGAIVDEASSLLLIPPELTASPVEEADLLVVLRLVTPDEDADTVALADANAVVLADVIAEVVLADSDRLADVEADVDLRESSTDEALSAACCKVESRSRV